MDSLYDVEGFRGKLHSAAHSAEHFLNCRYTPITIGKTECSRPNGLRWTGMIRVTSNHALYSYAARVLAGAGNGRSSSALNVPSSHSVT